MLCSAFSITRSRYCKLATLCSWGRPTVSFCGPHISIASIQSRREVCDHLFNFYALWLCLFVCGGELDLSPSQDRIFGKKPGIYFLSMKLTPRPPVLLPKTLLRSASTRQRALSLRRLQQPNRRLLRHPHVLKASA